MTDYSMFLFAQPSFLEGVARVGDIGGTLNEYNSSIDPAQADRLALRADIEALRQDVSTAREQLRDEIIHAVRK